MLKRTLIPPSHRPKVPGASYENPVDYIAIFKDDRRRRAFILDCIKGQQSIPGLDQKELQDILLELFPALKPLAGE